MPNSIERDVYVLRDTLKNPISYVRGTDLLPIILHFRDFTIPSGATAKVFVAKNDGNAAYGGATITGNDVTVDVTQQMFITLGVNLMQVEIDSGNETLVTFEQPVMVTPNLKAGDLPDSTTDVDFIDKIIEQAQEAVNDANAALETANTAISGANTAAESANSAAQNANNAAEELQDKVDAGDFTASVQVGTTTTLDPDQDATVSNSGTNKDVVLNFGIPKGDPGTAASIQVGTTQTVQPEENAEIINTGTTTAAVLNFKIPRGKDGMTDLTAEYKDDSSYTCQPTVNAPVVVKELDGKTEQVETTGAQLFDVENVEWEKVSTRCSVVADGNYLVFTADASDAFFGSTFDVGNTISNSSITIPVSANQEYTMSISNAYFNKNYITFADSDKSVISNYGSFATQTYSFVTPENCAYISIRFGRNNSQNGDTERFQIMLNKGPTALPYEPYTGGSPAPSPDYPQVIKGVGGMGYFDGEWVQGNISSTGAIGTKTTGITSANAIPCKQNDNIAVTYADSIDVIAVVFYNASGAYISTSTSGNSVDTFTATAPANAASFKVNLRVVSGSTITPNGAKYCTVTINGEYQTRVEVTGRNLINPSDTQGTSYSGLSMTNNNDGSFCFSGTNTYDGGTIFHINLSKVLVSGTEYYLTVNNNKAVSDVGIRLYNNDTYVQNIIEQLDSINESTSFILSEGQTANRLTVRFSQSGTTNGGFTIKPMLSIISSPQDFQPYHHTTLTIPLASPLYEGDKICYVKPGESYVDADGDTVIADRILYGVHRENATVVFDGSEDEGWWASNVAIYQAFGIQKEGVLSDGELKCNRLLYIPDNPVSSGNAIGIGDNSGGANNRIYVANGISENLPDFKTWLQSNPLTVLYKLAQPYFEPFVDQTLFYTLRTDDTLSYVYSNDPIEPVLTVEVAKNSTGGYLLESYAQAQKNAISEANSQSRLSAIEQQLVNQATAPTE